MNVLYRHLPVGVQFVDIYTQEPLVTYIRGVRTVVCDRYSNEIAQQEAFHSDAGTIEWLDCPWNRMILDSYMVEPHTREQLDDVISNYSHIKQWINKGETE